MIRSRKRGIEALVKVKPYIQLLTACALVGCTKPSISQKRPAPSAPPRTYTNPVYAGSMPDPSVIRHSGIYYGFGTTGAERTRDGRVFTVLGSRDLAHWERFGGALLPPSSDERIQYWAPEVTETGGMFYLYYAMGGLEPERFELRVATSVRPQGPYVDQAKLTDCESNRFTIDPFPFRDDDGQWYMFYARNFTNHDATTHPGTAIVVDRLLDMTQLAGQCQVVVRAHHDWTLYQANRHMDVYNATFDWHTIEGPCVVKHNKRYYCFFSGSNYQTTRYGVDYVVADHPLGPYSGEGDRPRVLQSIPGSVRGPGHHSIVFGPHDRFQYLVYHAWDPTMKVRWMCVDKLVWTAEGPRSQATTTPQPLPR